MDPDFLAEEGQNYGNFSLFNSQYIEELQTHLRELIHLPTGAQVMHLENGDPENVFCLSFKTLPDSSNGAPHILEHTVLCGSRKFPVKDPFFSMSRRSLNTFMNALTGSDFTCYPAATQVEKDFYNLLDVYLDACFHPLLKELSFFQEGHRLEFIEPTNPNSPLEFKGIVYNEMKGSLTSADMRIWHAMNKALVPDLTYAHNAGGEPEEIPDLSYAQLIEFHEKFYHPSRCLFFFYGNFPLKKHLDFIEEHALKHAQKLSPLDGIGHQKRFDAPYKASMSYPTSEKKDLKTKHIHAFGWLTTPLLNQEDVLALTILDSILMDTDASPLKKALLDTKLCVHADSYLDTEMTEVPLMMIVRECKQEDADALEHTLFDTLKKIAQEGIAFPLVEAAIHQLEFSRKEIGGEGSPFGLTLFMRSALAKQHGCAPELSLQIHTLFETILEKAKDPHFFSPLIEKYLVNNPHFVRLSFAPDPNLTSKEAQGEKEKLQKIKADLNEKDIAHILEQTKHLQEYQDQSEKQSLSCLPKVTLNDVPEEARHFPLDVYQRKDLKIFHHETFTNQILYADLVFDLPNLTEQEIFDLQLLLILWPEIGSGKRSFEENLDYIQAYTGGVSAHASLHVQATEPTHANPSLQLHGKALKRNMDKLFALFEDMITKPRFDEVMRIEELIKKLGSALQNRLPRNAMRYASMLAFSGFSVPNQINEKAHGLSFYQAVQTFTKNLETHTKEFIQRLPLLKEKILSFGTPNLVLTCEDKLYDLLDKKDFYGLSKLKASPHEEWLGNFPLHSIPDQARVLTSPVAFTIQGFKAVPYIHKEAPALLAATSLLENKVLHHRIREQGGAYGAGANYNPLMENLYFYAYRDPHIAHTLHTFNDSVCEIADGNFNRQDLEEAKLGIIQHFDTPTSPGNRGHVAYFWQRDGKSRQMRQDFRDRLLKLSKEDIQSALKNILLNQLDQGVIVTFAGQELLDKELPLIQNKTLQVLPIST